MSVFFLGVLASCAVILTASVLLVALHLHRVSLQLGAVLPALRSILGRTDEAAQRVGEIVRRSCAAAEGVVDQVDWVNDRIRSLMAKGWLKKRVNRRRKIE